MTSPRADMPMRKSDCLRWAQTWEDMGRTLRGYGYHNADGDGLLDLERAARIVRDLVQQLDAAERQLVEIALEACGFRVEAPQPDAELPAGRGREPQ